MKKLFLLFAFLLVILALPFLLIPTRLEVSKVALLATNERSAHRCLTQDELLQQLMGSKPTSRSEDVAAYSNDGIDFLFRLSLSDLVEVALKSSVLDVRSFISLQKLSADSTVAQWRAEIVTSKNPLTRIRQYLHAKKIHRNMGTIFGQLQAFSKLNKNVYGLAIERSTVSDSLLVTTRIKTATYPTPDVYYKLIRELQAYVDKSEAAPSNYPMLNITRIDSTAFQTTVALPVNKVLKDAGSISFKRMVAGKILSAETRGGSFTVEQGFKKVNNYLLDHELVTPAIPFQSLITDRMLETDTTKWITRIYYPVL